MGMDLRELARRTVEDTFGKGAPDAMAERAELSYVGHDPLAGTHSLGDAKALAAEFRRGFPDLRCGIHAVFTEGDQVACRWKISATHRGTFRGIAPTGRRVELEGLTNFRFHGNRVAESWTQYDALRLLRQLGVVPSLDALVERHADRQEDAQEDWDRRV